MNKELETQLAASPLGRAMVGQNATGKSLFLSFTQPSFLTRPFRTGVIPERQVKPRIGLSAELLPDNCEFPKKYVCHDDFLIIGFGVTKEEAYADWRFRHYSRTRIARPESIDLGVCQMWHADGCPAIEFFIGNLNVFSYDIGKDELILRG